MSTGIIIVHDQIAADLSVEHADTLEHYRAAHQVSENADAGNASTEDLRLAMIHYRALFGELLGEPSEAANSTVIPSQAPAIDGASTSATTEIGGISDSAAMIRQEPIQPAHRADVEEIRR